ncbi:MAG: SDR family oxidoreductase [Deltaproteobacteria bacterium]|nr:SDR family oxidoreductase [Deltaproteobacteria bacterium]
MEINLENKVAVVTGGGRGIGKAVALALAEAGADVVLAARTLSQLEEVADLVRSIGRRSLPVAMDVTDKKAVESLMSKAVEGLGGLHILVNNAAIMSPSPILETTEEDWDRVIAVNLKSCFLCTRAAGRFMIEQQYGKIINMASTGGVIAGPNNASYHASKAAFIHFTRAVAIEWIRHNINVNAIGPGTVDVPLADKFIQKGSRNVMLKAVPIKRFADTTEIANLALFLASDLSNYMVGEHVIIDGGLTIP